MTKSFFENMKSEDEAVFVDMAAWRSQRRRRGLGGDWMAWDGGNDGDEVKAMEALWRRRWHESRACRWESEERWWIIFFQKYWLWYQIWYGTKGKFRVCGENLVELGKNSEIEDWVW